MASQKGNSETLLKSLPVKRCQTRFCPEEGPFTARRIIFVGESLGNVIGWCQTCKRYVCSECAIWEEADKQQILALEDGNELKEAYLGSGKPATAVRCHHCGSFLGTGDDPIILA